MGLLSNFLARSRPCPLVVLYPVDHEAGWIPIDLRGSASTPSRAPGTAPAVARNQHWSVARPAVPTLGDLAIQYQHLLAKTARRPSYGAFKVQA
jgi:hypothetical protein